MPKVNQRVLITQRMLKETLLLLLEDKPIEKISITELCSEAGINRTTFYSHYETPRDILLAIEQDFINDLSNHLQQSLENPDANLLCFAELMCQYIYDHAKLVRIMLRNSADYALMQKLHTSFRVMFKEYMPHNIDDKSMHLIISYLSGGSLFLFKNWLEENMDKSPREIAHLMTGFFEQNL